MSDISNVITAACAVLGVLGGFFVWLNSIIQSRRPEINFVVTRMLSSQIYRVSLYPTRGKFVYTLEAIHSQFPLYSRFTGVDILGQGVPELQGELRDADIYQIIPSRYQKIENEPFMEFYLNLKAFQGDIYSLRLLFKSEHFPFRWGKRISVPKR